MKRVDLLILDDEAPICRAIERLLVTGLDLRIECVGDPAKALELLAARPPKVILSDFRMPGMDGVKVLAEARRLAPDTIRILMTGMAERAEVIEAINRGKIFRFLEKPWDDASLVALVAEAIETYDHNSSRRRAVEEHADLRSAVDMAGSIQRSLLPEPSPRLKEAEAACLFTAFEYATGDYVDVFPVADGKTALLLGDVSGHGLGAALFVSTARALLRSGLSEGEDLGHVIGRTNRFLCRDMQNGRFLTLFAALHDASAGTLEFVNAGHLPPLLLSGTSITRLPRTGLPLGVIDEADYSRPARCLFRAGEILLAYTDGVVESRSPEGELLGMERLCELVRSEGARGPDALVARVRDETVAWSAGASEDDLTLLAYRPRTVVALEPAPTA